MAKVIKSIVQIDKGNGSVLKVTVSEFKGFHYLDIREWFPDEETSELKPTKRGVTLKSEAFESLMDALEKSREEIRSLLAGSKK